jgi:hypothetical protein
MGYIDRIFCIILTALLLTFVTQNVFAADPYTAFNKCLADAKTGEAEQQCNKIMPVIDRCNNTSTNGPFTNFFNGINGCPVKVLFESPNSVQLQYDDMMGGGGYITQLESGYHWYEISHQDDGSTTTIVLAPLR